MYKRIVALACAFVLLFTGIAGRCLYISINKNYAVSDSYNSITVNLSKLYTNIYSSKGTRLNNNRISYAAVIKPNEKCLSELGKLFNTDEIKSISRELSNGYPVVRYINRFVETKYIKIIKIKNQNSDTMLCRSLLDKSCGGLEHYVNREIGSLSINFPIDATGRLLTGDGEELINNNYDNSDGIVISIDDDIQKIAETAAASIPKGAVVIMNPKTSAVLASVSKGDDYINRALSPYAVGSVFKIVVSLCAVENNVDLLYKCESKIKIGDTVFECQNKKTHGIQSMADALANSCNCYFVNLALKLGKTKIINTAESLGFGKQFELYDNWYVNSGVFPSAKQLDSKGQLSLIGFGQGMLTDSPMHFASVVSCIANGGIYNSPTLDISEARGKRAVQEASAKKVTDFMRAVVTNGTGRNAEYNNNSAGKTATAQSGIYQNNKEVLNTWFAGFYPYSNPKYVIVVMREDGKSGAGDCCPVFRTIVEKIDKL